MKREKAIKLRIAYSRFLQNIESRNKKKLREKRKKLKERQKKPKKYLYNSIFEVLESDWIPTNLRYILTNKNSDFHIEKLKSVKQKTTGECFVPEIFSLIVKPKESYEFIKDVIAEILFQRHPYVTISYKNCEKVDLGTEVFFDIILNEFLNFLHKCEKSDLLPIRLEKIGGDGSKNENVNKILYSVGPVAIHTRNLFDFKDIIPYRLCTHNRTSDLNSVKNSERKDIDTTTLVDYVLESLKRLNKTLTIDKREDLCTVIGEILINAEEHSTTKHRFSIGYFQEITTDKNHYGLFHLVILNFGHTIYEKFKDPDCPNKDIVKKMQDLSERYSGRAYFFQKDFTEETLWTLYALQEGVTSVPHEEYRKRGNGSIRFIDSFFNIKGPKKERDDISKMSILSGSTQIDFDGTYNITEKEDGPDKFKVMTFNKSGNIEEKPDSKYVKSVENYFPGTIISAEILFNEDDLEEAES